MGPTAYSRAQVALHWVVVVLVALQIAFAGGMSAAFWDGMEAGALTATVPAALHMGTGTAIFLVMAARLLIRLERGAPPPPDTDPEWQQRAARAVHWAFYALALALPVTGGAAWYQASETMAQAHSILRVILIALIALHIAAALYGQVIQRSGVLGRMRP